MNKLTPASMLYWLVSAGVLILLLLLPFRIPYTIKTIGKIQPHREWLVIRAADGQISTQLWNHESALVESMTVTQMLRGDAADFRLLADPRNSTQIAAGDTVGMLHSADMELSLISMESDLASAKASLLVLETGEKQPLIEEAQHQMEQSILLAQDHQRLLDRLTALHNNHLLSDQEFEQALASQKAHEAEIAIARSRLASLQTGAKHEEIALMKVGIHSLEREIAALRQKSAGWVLRSPLTGMRIHHFASDTLLAVAETDSFMLIMPLSSSELTVIEGNEVVELHSGDGEISGKGHLVFINPKLELLNRTQIFWAVARIEKSHGLVPGMFLESAIRCKALTKYRFLQRFLEK